MLQIEWNEKSWYFFHLPIDKGDILTLTQDGIYLPLGEKEEINVKIVKLKLQGMVGTPHVYVKTSRRGRL